MRTCTGTTGGSPLGYPLLGLTALLLFSSVVSVQTVNRDTVPLVADPAGYYRTTLVLDELLQQGRLAEAGTRLVRPGIRPPLPQLVTIALYHVLGERSQRVARLSVLCFLWLLLVSTYGIGARLKDPTTGLVAAVLLACFPQVVGYSRSYWMDLPLAAMTALSIWVLLATDGLRRRGLSLLFGLTVGLGMLTKYSFGVFAGAPATYLFIAAVRRAQRAPRPRRQVRRVVENACLALLVAAATAAFWYMPTLDAAWRNWVFNRGSDVLPPRDPLTLDNLLLYLRYLALQLGTPLTALLVLCLPLFWRLSRGPARAVLLLWLLVPYLFFSLVVLGIEWARFTLPYLPAVALVVALALTQLRLHLLLRGAAIAVCVGALLGQVTLTYGPAAPLPHGTFPWRRARSCGPVTASSFAFQPDLERLFPAPATRRSVQVALAPDAGRLASLLETLALEQGRRVRVSAPYEPEAHGFGGRFAFPARVDDPGYLAAFDYLVLVELPDGVSPGVRRPDLYRRFVETWRQVRRRFVLTRRVSVPGGFRLLVHANGG